MNRKQKNMRKDKKKRVLLDNTNRIKGEDALGDVHNTQSVNLDGEGSQDFDINFKYIPKGVSSIANSDENIKEENNEEGSNLNEDEVAEQIEEGQGSRRKRNGRESQIDGLKDKEDKDEDDFANVMSKVKAKNTKDDSNDEYLRKYLTACLLGYYQH